MRVWGQAYAGGITRNMVGSVTEKAIELITHSFVGLMIRSSMRREGEVD